MIGRRLPDADMDRPHSGWKDWQAGQPGDYMKVLDGERASWWVMDPAGSIGRLTTHTVVEHEDGTITVSPSILDPSAGGWHGYLERGVWRSC